MIFKRVINLFIWLLMPVLYAAAIFLVMLDVYLVYKNATYVDKTDKNIVKMYNKLWAMSGQSGKKRMFVIAKCSRENAWVDNIKIVLCRELIANSSSLDEIALVLGHEIAHAALSHTNGKPQYNNDQDLEAQADKLGAVYMMKAGYNVCKGRRIFFRWLEATGDNVFTKHHPSKAYRYNQLNIGCGKI